jgi:hypothetical protein
MRRNRMVSLIIVDARCINGTEKVHSRSPLTCSYGEITSSRTRVVL